ncbi:MAG: hypothetical protein JWN30_2463, partial [Bacilli bacterium]|nr:hypothetical protein [Bacilli bacterium]
IERPASIVKELVENSIDAGSTRIQIQLEQSGLTLIEVTDNGIGIERAELPLAFERHATSKLATEKDLFRIQTLGFRGEALPSIASVARVTITSRTEHAPEGASMQVAGGECQPLIPAPCNLGTTIKVEDLFYNTPVRLKYLKSLQTELGHCLEIVQKLALAHPQISFQLIHQGKTHLQTQGDAQLLHAFSSIYGKELAKQMLQCLHTYRDHTVKGIIGLPAISRANRNHGLLFLNGRPIRHFGILNAIQEAYGHRLPIHRFPLFALDLELDYSLVDVNVHPTKLEVRFSEEADIRTAVREAVEQALDQQQLIPAFGASVPKVSPNRIITNENYEQVSLPQLPQQRRTESFRTGEVREQVQEIYRPLSPQLESKPNESPASTDQAENPAAGRLLQLKPVAQLLGMYVVAENPDGMYIIDQHAAHERILFERFSRNYNERNVSPMPLLVPLTRELTPGEKTAFERLQSELSLLAFDMELFGEFALVVRAVPDVWAGQQPETLTMEFLDEWFQNMQTAASVIGKLEERIITKACKAAIKANQWLSMPEMAALCKGLDELQDPFHCPHGRPILLHFSHYELEKQFKRVM